MRDEIKYITAAPEMAEVIHNILHTTIRVVYPKYYPAEVVDFFCQHHSMEHVLEREILKKHDTVFLEASFPGVCLYEHRGYKTVRHEVCQVENDVKLVYEVMEKRLR